MPPPPSPEPVPPRPDAALPDESGAFRSIALLLFAAMAIFVFTVVIGILNGTDLVTFPTGAILAHVHSGTLGWITLSVFAGTAWILGAERVPPALANLSVLAVVLYIGAFWLDNAKLRPVAGTFMLVMIFWFAGWAFAQRKGEPLTVTKLAMLLSMINLCIGAILGVLLGLALANIVTLPRGIAEAHPAMMVAGYLILAGAGLDEALLGGKGATQMTKPGAAQAIMLFLAGIILAVALLLDIQPLLGLNLLFEVLGVAFAVVRLWPKIAGAGWGTAGPGRHAAVSLLFLIFGIGLLAFLIIKYSKDFSATPPGLFIALDHATFIGVLTNGIFGLLFVATAARKQIWAGADQIVFWGLNLGLIGFLAGLLADNVMLKRISTPVMGACILLGLLTYAMRFSKGREAAPAPA